MWRKCLRTPLGFAEGQRERGWGFIPDGRRGWWVVRERPKWDTLGLIRPEEGVRGTVHGARPVRRSLGDWPWP